MGDASGLFPEGGGPPYFKARLRITEAAAKPLDFTLE
jgi:hypothetical protein